MNVATRKRLFLGLLTISLLTLVAGFFLVWFLTAYRTYPINRVLLQVLAITVIGVFALAALGIGAIVITIWSSRHFPFLQKSIRIAINTLFPIALAVGKVLGIDKDVVKSSFVEVSNQLVRSRPMTVPAEKILILTPHCLQKHTCPHKITLTVDNCRRCGQCPIDGLRSLQESYGVKLVVASGGTFARKLIKEHRPRAIVAVACERDLTSGIKDVPAIPVLGVLNQRPEGPCYNTLVDLPRVEQAIRFFLTGSGEETVLQKGQAFAKGMEPVQ